MTQFMICRQRPAGNIPKGVVCLPLGNGTDSSHNVAERYFGSVRDVQVVVDESGFAAPLVDAIWEKLSIDAEIEECPLVQLFARLFEERIEFILWCSSDFDDLPLVRTWTDLKVQLGKHAATQPADVWMYCCPD